MYRRIPLSVTICALLLSIFQVTYAQISEFKIMAGDGTAHDQFGLSVSISDDYAVVGAWADDDNGTKSGSAYVFMRRGTSWVQVTKLLPLKEDGTSDGHVNDYFGRSVSISGDYIIVGAHGNDDNKTDSGSAYIFKRDGTSWRQQVKIIPSDRTAYDQFGLSVSISGNYAMVGARSDDDNGTDSGSSYIFKRSDTNWLQEAKLLPINVDGTSDGDVNDWFGSSISISGDYAIVGAHRNDDNGTDSGSAYVFKRTGTSWTQETKLLPTDGTEGDNFGASVSISGDYAIVGAYGNDENGTDAGSAYLFKRIGTTWVQDSKLLPSDGALNDLFGYSVSVSGYYAVVGASGDDESGTYSGSVYLFKRTSASSSQETKLLPSDGALNDLFGYSVSISSYYAVVGAELDDNGTNSGSVFPLINNTSNWTEVRKFLPSDGDSFDRFGWSVSVSNNYVIVGAQNDDDYGIESGSAYVFKHSGKSWAEEINTAESEGAALDEFGFPVSAYMISNSSLETFQCVTPPPDMVAWWSLDETAGKIVDNITGFNSVGTLFGKPVSILGKVDRALSFNGITDFVEVANSPELNFGIGDFSIDAWVKSNTITGTRTIADKRSGTNSNPHGYSLYLYNGYVGLQLADKSGFYNYNNNLTNSTIIADGLWHHIAVTVARNDFRGLRFYVDGELESIKNPMPYSGSLDNSNVFRIASQSYVMDPNYMFNGVVDELELFRRVLTPAEVKSIWSADSLGKCKKPILIEED